MDPIATIAIINDPTNDTDTRCSHLHYLAEWMGKGGAIPYGHNIDADACDFFEAVGDAHLAFAVRCAIENADLSGLEGIGYEVIR